MTAEPTCPSCGSPTPFEVRQPCSLDRYDPHDWHSPAVAAEPGASIEAIARAIDPESWRIRDTGPFPPEHEAARAVVRRSTEAAKRVQDAIREGAGH